VFSKSLKSGRTPYAFDKQVAFFESRVEANYSKINNDFQRLMNNSARYIFPDAIYFLKTIPKKKLFLLSYGDIVFQKNKIKNSGINKYFSKIIINTENKINFILKECDKDIKLFEEKIFFVDDRPDNLAKIEKAKKEIITIRMRRPEGRYSNLDCDEADYEVKNLEEASEIINSLK
jgi:FMN phosphatase YigB (HAD superfamily)